MFTIAPAQIILSLYVLPVTVTHVFVAYTCICFNTTNQRPIMSSSQDSIYYKKGFIPPKPSSLSIRSQAYVACESELLSDGLTLHIHTISMELTIFYFKGMTVKTFFCPWCTIPAQVYFKSLQWSSN